MLKAVAYVRGPTSDRQVKEIEEFLKNRSDIGLIKIYRDLHGIGKQVETRKSYLKMVDNYKNWDVILISSIDVSHTDIGNLFKFLEFIYKTKKHFISIKEGVDTSRDPQFIHGVTEMKKVFDSTIGEYISPVIAKKARLDTWRGQCPYGYKVYKIENGKKTLVPVSPAKDIVIYIYEKRSEGLSYKIISEKLNTERIPAPSGGKWFHAKIMNILENKIYWGYREVYDEAGDTRWVPHNYEYIVTEELGRFVYRMRATQKERKK